MTPGELQPRTDLMKKILLPIASLIVSLLPLMAADAPKKLLVVTTTAAFRHTSIPTGERIVAQLGKESGEFTVDFLRQPDVVKPPVAPKQPVLKTNATEADQAAFQAA